MLKWGRVIYETLYWEVYPGIQRRFEVEPYQFSNELQQLRSEKNHGGLTTQRLLRYM